MPLPLAWRTSQRAGTFLQWAIGPEPVPISNAERRNTGRGDNVLSSFPHALASSHWVLAQVGETDKAWSCLREGEELLERKDARETIDQAGMDYQWLGRAALVLGRLDDAHRVAGLSLQHSPSHPGFAAGRDRSRSPACSQGCGTSVHQFAAGQRRAAFAIATAERGIHIRSAQAVFLHHCPKLLHPRLFGSLEGLSLGFQFLICRSMNHTLFGSDRASDMKSTSDFFSPSSRSTRSRASHRCSELSELAWTRA